MKHDLCFWFWCVWLLYILKLIYKYITMKNFFKNLTIQVLLFGSIGVGFAAWNTLVSDGETLTATGWNDIVNQLISMDSDITTLSNAVVSFDGGEVVWGATEYVTESITLSSTWILNMTSYTRWNCNPSSQQSENVGSATLIDGDFCSFDRDTPYINNVTTSSSASCSKLLWPWTYSIQSRNSISSDCTRVLNHLTWTLINTN